MAYPPYPTGNIPIPPHAAIAEHRADNDCGGRKVCAPHRNVRKEHDMTVETTPITPTTETGTDVGALVAALDDAQATLAAFESEASSIPEEIRAAAEDENAALVISLRQRYDAVPTYIHATQLLVARRSVALMEARLAEGESSYACAAEAASMAEAALQKVQAKVEDAIGVARDRQYEINARRISLQQQKRALEDLLHESAQPIGVPVRSLWQQG